MSFIYWKWYYSVTKWPLIRLMVHVYCNRITDYQRSRIIIPEQYPILLCLASHSTYWKCYLQCSRYFWKLIEMILVYITQWASNPKHVILLDDYIKGIYKTKYDEKFISCSPNFFYQIVRKPCIIQLEHNNF